MASTTTRMKAGALACLAGLALAACSSDAGGFDLPDIAEDCTEADFDEFYGTPARAECGFGVITVDIDRDGIMVARSEIHVHALAFLTAVGEVSGQDYTVEDFLESYNAELEDYMDYELSYTISNWDTGEELGAAGDHISADDFLAELRGHALVVRLAEVSHVTAYSTVVYIRTEGEAIIIDGIAGAGFADAAGFLTVTFPGPVAEANGEISGNSVRWEWGVGEAPEAYAVYRP